MSRFRVLWQASLNATKRALTWNLEDLIPPSERYIFNFNSKEELKKWHLYSDSEYGGLSSASLEIRDAGNELRGVFSGKLSLDVAEDSKWNISRSGFCGMRSKKFDGLIDLDAYDTIALKVKGDGRCYISTIYTENWVNSPGQEEDNSWQAFVFVPRDNWYIAKIPLARYLPTWRGNIIDVDLEMNPSRIVGMSLSVNAEGGVQVLCLAQVIFKWKSIGLKPRGQHNFCLQSLPSNSEVPIAEKSLDQTFREIDAELEAEKAAEKSSQLSSISCH